MKQFTKISSHICALGALMAMMPVTTAQAAIVTYTDFASWSAALGGAVVQTEDFTAPVSDIDISNGSYSNGGLTVTGNVVASSTDNVIIDERKNALDINSIDAVEGDNVTLSFTPGAFAAAFYGDLGDATDDRLTVTQGGNLIASLANPLRDGIGFFGIVDDTGAALGDLILGAASGGLHTEIDEIHWASAAEVPPAVPLPGAFGFLAFGLAGFGLLRRRGS